jgi:hypothetical protein
VIAGLLAPRTDVAIIWTRGICSADLDMRAGVFRVVTATGETELAGNAFIVASTALAADELPATVGSCSGTGVR